MTDILQFKIYGDRFFGNEYGGGGKGRGENRIKKRKEKTPSLPTSTNQTNGCSNTGTMTPREYTEAKSERCDAKNEEAATLRRFTSKI